MRNKIIVFFLVLASAALLWAQPAAEATDEIRVAALKGPTAMGLVRLMDEAESGPVDGNSYSFSIVASPTEMTPMIVRGEVDIAALPANLASVIYNNTDGAIQVLAVNTLGVLYIVENGDSVHSLEDLAGRTVYASGKGSTPEYSLSYSLEEAGLADSVRVEWMSEHAECVAALLNDPEGVALSPQPFVTTAMLQNPDIRVIVARKDFVEAEPDAVDRFLDQYRASTDFANSSTQEAAALVGKYDIVPEKVAAIALPECNIVCITGDGLRSSLGPYLEVLYNANPASVGGSLPGEDFYY